MAAIGHGGPYTQPPSKQTPLSQSENHRARDPPRARFVQKQHRAIGHPGQSGKQRNRRNERNFGREPEQPKINGSLPIKPLHHHSEISSISTLSLFLSPSTCQIHSGSEPSRQDPRSMSHSSNAPRSTGLPSSPRNRHPQAINHADKNHTLAVHE